MVLAKKSVHLNQVYTQSATSEVAVTASFPVSEADSHQVDHPDKHRLPMRHPLRCSGRQLITGTQTVKVEVIRHRDLRWMIIAKEAYRNISAFSKPRP